jgi:hypothetical protein
MPREKPSFKMYLKHDITLNYVIDSFMKLFFFSVFFFFFFPLSIQKMSSDNLHTLAQKYQELRHIFGKAGGSEYDERVDSPTGEKYQVMKVQKIKADF